MEKREKFSSRLGFILISAGCAIGLGNVWRFPYITGQYGGGAFVLIYLFFLLVLGLPIIIMEFADVLVRKVLPYHMRYWNQKEANGIFTNILQSQGIFF